MNDYLIEEPAAKLSNRMISGGMAFENDGRDAGDSVSTRFGRIETT